MSMNPSLIVVCLSEATGEAADSIDFFPSKFCYRIPINVYRYELENNTIE